MDSYFDSDLPPFEDDALPPPRYSPLALPYEQTLLKSSTNSAHAGEPRDARLAFGGPAATVTFLAQERGATMPSYGRGAVVDGEILLRARDRVVGVQVAIEGRVVLQRPPGEGGREEFPFLALAHKVGLDSDHDDQQPRSASAARPHTFAILLPPTFDDDGTDRPLPPTFRHELEGTSVEVEYRCVVSITTARAFLGFTQTQRFPIPFSYKPRLRPPRPAMDPEHTFLSTVKAAPDEWAETGLRIDAREMGMSPLHCDVVFPSSRIYAPQQRVPVYVQISGTASILSDASTGSSSPSPSHSQFQASSTQLDPSVVLERRIAVCTLSGVSCAIERLGDARLQVAGASGEAQQGWHAWEGEFQVGSCDAPSFRVGPLVVSDHLVFAVTARKGAPYESRHMSIPARIVTDSFPTEDAL